MGKPVLVSAVNRNEDYYTYRSSYCYERES